jgi:ribosomal protein S18 acetylase RimI-like enzyme
MGDHVRVPEPQTVRTATEADEHALRALDAAAWAPASLFPSVLARLGSEPFFADSRPAADHLVAELDGEVVGYVRLQPPTPLPEGRHVLGVNGLAVAPSARGRGVAQALLAAAEQRARETGAGKLSLRVLGTNAAARALYERAGFVVEGVLRAEFRIDGRDVDDYLMARHLD